MSLKNKVLCSLSFALLFGGCIGLKNDWTLWYYSLSWIPALAVGGGMAAIVGTNRIRACDVMYSGVVIVTSVSVLFHQDMWYLIGRLSVIIGATIMWMISIDYADNK